MTRDDFRSALVQEGGTSSRRAALLLHELDASDRAWLLEQLDPAQRALLTALLGELTALGVPPTAARGGPTMSDVATAAPRSAPAAVSPMSTAADRIMRTPLAEVVDILRREPDALVARVMPHMHPEWSRRFLAHLDPAHRARIAARSTEDAVLSPAEALDLAIVQAICSRVGRHTVHANVLDGVGSAIYAIGRAWQRLRTASRIRSGVAL